MGLPSLAGLVCGRRPAGGLTGAGLAPSCVLIGMGLAVISVQCTRTYHPVSPRVTHGKRVNTSFEGASLQWLGAKHFEVETRVATSPGTALLDARLALLDGPPCENGVLFIDVYKDDVVQPEGPVDIAGRHRMRFVFNGKDAVDGPLHGATAIDLLVRSKDGTSCERIPLAADEPELTWELDASSAGFYVATGARLFPIETTTAVGLEPLWTAFLREGATFGENRLWFEVSGGLDQAGDFAVAVLSVGGDRVLWQGERWVLALGLSYDLGVTGPVDQRDAPARYGVHGPRLTPSLAWSPFNLTRIPGFPGGRRNGYIELELPVSGWFAVQGSGAPTPPTFVIVPGIGLSISYAL